MNEPIYVILKVKCVNKSSEILPELRGVTHYIDAPGGQMSHFGHNFHILRYKIPYKQQNN
jgi:hypothetical protein